MADKPDIRVLVGTEGGASIDGRSGQLILKELTSVAKQIKGDKVPKVVFGVDIDKTKSRFERELKSVVNGIKNIPIDLSFKSIEKEVYKSVSSGVKKGLTSYTGTDQIKSLGKIYVGDRSKGNPIDNITKQLLSRDGVTNVGITGKNYFEGQKEQLKSFTATVTMATGEVQKLDFELAKIGKRKGFVQTDSSSFKFNTQISNIKAIVSEFEKLEDAYKSLNTSENYANKLGNTDLLERIPKLKEELGMLISEVSRFKDSQGGFGDLGEHLNDKGFIDFVDKVKVANRAISDLQKAATVENPLFVKDERIAKQARDVSDFALSLGKFERANDKFKGNSGAAAEFERIKVALSDIQRRNQLGEDIGIDLDNLKKKTNDWKSSLDAVGISGQTAFGKLKAQMEKLGVYLSASAIMMGAWRQAKNTIQDVIELDKAVTDLQIATGYTRDRTKELLDTYSEMGKQLGANTVDVAKSADDWLRQGYSIQETNTLIKNSMMLSKLGQIDSADATKALTSSMKGYNIAVEDSIGIVDKFTSVDMSAAVSAGYIATALAETATSARLAGIDLDKVTGYIAAIGETTQDGAESVGNFAKTLFARMGNIKAGKLFDPESEESLSDVETTLSGLGIKLRESSGEFRNFGEVLDEVASKWESYGSVNQRAIAVAFSGTRQQEKFLTLMEKYGDATKYATIATNSAGTALDKYENSYLKSVEASQEKFTAQFEQLSNTIWNSDFIKGTFDAGTGLLGTLTSIIDKLGTIPTLATVAAGAISVMGNKGELKTRVLMCLRPFATVGNNGQDQYEDGVLCLGVA